MPPTRSPFDSEAVARLCATASVHCDSRVAARPALVLVPRCDSGAAWERDFARPQIAGRYPEFSSLRMRPVSTSVETLLPISLT
jgi:hypothetical protein